MRGVDIEDMGVVSKGFLSVILVLLVEHPPKKLPVAAVPAVALCILDCFTGLSYSGFTASYSCSYSYLLFLPTTNLNQPFLFFYFFLFALR